MTENKRFNRFDVYFDDFMQLWTVSDNENDNMLYPCTSENMANEFCKLLNELNDENKELKRFLKKNCPLCGANLELFYEESRNRGDVE